MQGTGLKLAGVVYYQPLVAGVYSDDVIELFETAKVAINNASNAIKRAGRSHENHGRTTHSITLPGETTIVVEGDDANEASTALALSATQHAFSQSSGTVTDAVVGLKVGVWLQRPHFQISAAGLTLKSADGETTYVEGTDYLVKRDAGLIKALTEQGAAADNKLSYAYPTIAGRELRGGAPMGRGRVIVVGKNLVSGQRMRVIVDDADLAPRNELDLSSDQLVRISLGGDVRFSPGAEAPYRVQYL